MGTGIGHIVPETIALSYTCNTEQYLYESSFAKTGRFRSWNRRDLREVCQWKSSYTVTGEWGLLGNSQRVERGHWSCRGQCGSDGDPSGRTQSGRPDEHGLETRQNTSAMRQGTTAQDVGGPSLRLSRSLLLP